ncbi:MAG: MBL fold metallo-hydrolase [Syntrophorhabdaceae bacterium]|nr:MBL fold metallo-hydrolase [Syntrophorhabdales bacterium]MBP9560941.1 MBL fold metallo-hydrolase [Syntrophorhabdaceae bacterium]
MEGFIKFLGTGGARFVVAKQIRATGGLWLHYRKTNLYIDPGPGAIVRVRASKDHLDPANLDGIILTHKHLDHSNDINVMIEAMTDGGFKRKGTVYCPGDAIGDDPVIFRYIHGYMEHLEILEERQTYTIKDIAFTTSMRHIHPVETYGILFHLNKKIGILTDTRYFEGLKDFYKADYLIVNVLRSKPIKETHIIDHLSTHDLKQIAMDLKPEVVIMTHFGMNIIMEKPHLVAENLKNETGVNIIAAHDGMKLEF